MTKEQQHLNRADLSNYLEAIYSHGKEWAKSFVIAAALVGILAIFSYLSAIGRPDLFMASISVSPALFIWLLFCFLMLLAFIFCLLVPSILLSLLWSMFEVSQVEERELIYRCFYIVIAGFSVLCGVIFNVIPVGPFWGLLIVFLVGVLGAFLLFGRSVELQERFVARRNKDVPENIRKWAVALFVFIVGLAAGFAAIAGVFPAVFAIWSYRGSDQVTVGVVAICLVSMLASCLPALAYLLVKGSLLRKYLGAFFALIICFVIFWVLSPGIFGVLTYSAAQAIGVRGTQVNRYVVTEKFPVAAFDEKVWGVDKLSSDKLFAIEAFKLYGFGGVQLLCPRKLLAVDLRDLPSRSMECVAVVGDKIYLAPPSYKMSRSVEVPERDVDCLAIKEFAKPPFLPSGKAVCITRQVL